MRNSYNLLIHHYNSEKKRPNPYDFKTKKEFKLKLIDQQIELQRKEK